MASATQRKSCWRGRSPPRDRLFRSGHPGATNGGRSRRASPPGAAWPTQLIRFSAASQRGRACSSSSISLKSWCLPPPRSTPWI